MNNSKAIAIVLEYISKLERPGKHQPLLYFAFYSYSRWAAKELLKELEQHSDMPAIDVVEHFARKMDHFSTMNKDTSFCFSTAHDVATDILDELILEKKGWMCYAK